MKNCATCRHWERDVDIYRDWCAPGEVYRKVRRPHGTCGRIYEPGAPMSLDCVNGYDRSTFTTDRAFACSEWKGKPRRKPA